MRTDAGGMYNHYVPQICHHSSEIIQSSFYPGDCVKNAFQEQRADEHQKSIFIGHDPQRSSRVKLKDPEN